MDKSIEIVYDKELCIAFVGENGAGKSTLASAISPQGILTEGASIQDVDAADFITFVHRLDRSTLSDNERILILQIRNLFGDSFHMRLIVLCTRADACDVSLQACTEDTLSKAITELVGTSVPVYAVAPPLWVLARREATEGREINARCFRESSGMSPIVRLIENHRRKIQN